MQKELSDQDLGSIFELETDLFPCLVDMRFLGVKVDVSKAHEVKRQLTLQEEMLLHKIKKRNRPRHSNMGSQINCQSF